MNLNYFRTLITVVEAGSFSAAARQLGLTQPAVSMHIQALEDYFGTKLIERSGKSIELTRAGELALQNASRLLEGVDSTRKQIDEMLSDVAGPVFLGASTIPGEYLCPALLCEFMRRFPRVKPRLIIDISSVIVEKLTKRELDLALVGAQPKDPTIKSDPVFQDELVLLVHSKHRFAGQREIPLAEVYKEKFISRTSGSGSRNVFERELAAAGFSLSKLNTVLEVGTSLAAVNAVEAKLGVTLVSMYAAEKSLRLGTVSAVRLAGLNLTRSFYIATIPQKYGGRAVTELSNFLRSPDARQVIERREL